MKKYLMAIMAVLMISTVSITAFASTGGDVSRPTAEVVIEETTGGTDKDTDEASSSDATETINISGQKNWVGDTEADRPETITIHLYADGKDTGHKVEADADGDWKYSFEKFPAYDGDKLITYSVVEDAVEGYKVSYQKVQ